MPNAELIRRMARGDRDALIELQQRLGNTVYAVAYGILIAPDEAARVVSETFDEAWSTAASFDQLCHKVDNWLITRARDRARERAASLRPRNSGGKRARPGA